MQHINNNLATIHRRIMLRVWYSYFISVLTSGVFFYGLVFGGALAAFGRLTHVSAIMHNLADAPVLSIPKYVLGTMVAALNGGEVLTVVVTLCLITMTLGALNQLRTIIHKIPQAA